MCVVLYVAITETQVIIKEKHENKWDGSILFQIFTANKSEDLRILKANRSLIPKFYSKQVWGKSYDKKGFKNVQS